MNPEDSLLTLIQRLQNRVPSYLALMTAQSDAEFDEALSLILEQAVRHLEANSRNFELVGEVGLSAILAAALTMPGLTVTQEAHSNGHVDLIIHADLCSPKRTVLTEAKVYNGYAYHLQGLRQLLGRYSTGRDAFGLIINYVRRSGIKDIVIKLRTELDLNLPEGQQGPCENHPMHWCFRTRHLHRSGETIGVSHINCNLSY